MRKDAHFGSVNIIKENGKPDKLDVGDFFEGCSMQVRDAEIKDNVDSPEIVAFEFFEGGENTSEVFIHKKDCLQLASFLLNIHTEYANRMNELDFEDYKKQYFKEVEA